MQQLKWYPWMTLRSIKGHFESQAIVVYIIVKYLMSISNYENVGLEDKWMTSEVKGH